MYMEANPVAPKFSLIIHVNKNDPTNKCGEIIEYNCLEIINLIFFKKPKNHKD